jgi:hypothetical protein
MDALKIIAGLVLAYFVIRFLWRGYAHPSHVLGRQAANMNWVAVGRVPDGDFKNLKLSRGEEIAIISFRNKNVELLRLSGKKVFKDFIELERWLVNNPTNMDDDDNDEDDLPVPPMTKRKTGLSAALAPPQYASHHDALDEMTEKLKPLIRAVAKDIEGERLDVVAELLGYCTAYAAKKVLRSDIRQIVWNSLISCIEYRIIALVKEKPILSGKEDLPNGGIALVSYCSEYRATMKRLEDLIDADFSMAKPMSIESIFDELEIDTSGATFKSMNELNNSCLSYVGFSAREVVSRFDDDEEE